MLNALYKDIDWKSVTTVGFDMDGTLYDEYDFIKQVYSEINRKLIQNENILSFMLNRWIEKGSSYPYIFDEAYEKCKNISYEQEDFTQKALGIFRNYTPVLFLSERNKTLLLYFQRNFKLFLVTDGCHELQKKKFMSLKLSKYFDERYVVFTGEYAPDYHKPNTKSLEFIDLNLDRSVFFGDRDKDEEFALSSNMQFKRVSNMIEVRL